AAGNLTFFQDAVMRSEGVGVHQRRTYDGLGRLLTLESMRGLVAEALLFGFDYDGIASPPLGCPEPDSSNLKGRIQRQIDSLGSTWFQYSASGKMLGAYRQRAGESGCTSGHSERAPNSFYVYDAADRLESERYPHGRILRYRYGSEGQRGRIVGID